MKFLVYADPQQPGQLQILNLARFVGVEPDNNGNSKLLYHVHIGAGRLTNRLQIPVDFNRMQEVMAAAEIDGDPHLSVSRVYDNGDYRVKFRSESAVLSERVKQATAEDIGVQASRIKHMSASKPEDGAFRLEINLKGEKAPIKAVGDFSPLLPHLMLADPSILRTINALPAGAIHGEIVDEMPPDIRGIADTKALPRSNPPLLPTG